MPSIQYQGVSYTLEAGESILDCLLRHGVDYPHSCQAGVCQSCLIKGTGAIAHDWQEGIQDTLKAQGYFLACLAKPENEIALSSPLADDCEKKAEISELFLLTHNVMRVRLAVDDLNPWTPGQYLNLINPQGIIRSYSIANLPKQDGFIELHIKLQDQGAMGSWLKEKAKTHEKVKIRGPLGQCFYLNPQKLSYDILLAGTGTGLAPLIAIAKDALGQNHPGSITLIHGGVVDEDLYYVNELQNLAKQNADFRYEPCVLQGNGQYPIVPIDQKIVGHIKDPKSLKVFVCGPKDTTNKLKMKAFLAGVPSSHILSDAFL